MDVVDWLVSLRRRWVIALLVLLVTAGAVFGVGSAVNVRYEANASLVLLGPSSYVDQEGADVKVNPYARFGGAGEGITGTTLVALLMSPQTLRQAEEDGFPGEYTVMFNPNGGGAILDLTVTSATPGESLRGLDRIVATAQDTLLAQQTGAGAPESSLVRASVLTRDEEPGSLNGARIRAMGATAVFGVVLAFLLTRVLDVRRRSRDARRAGAGEGGVEAPAPPSGAGVNPGKETLPPSRRPQPAGRRSWVGAVPAPAPAPTPAPLMEAPVDLERVLARATARGPKPPGR